MRAGVYVYAAGSIAAGILDLIWRDFEAAHQPIQALGDHIPGREILAYIAAICLIAGGVAILWRRTVRAGAWALAAIYFIFAVFWLPRFYTATHLFGFRIAVLIGMLVGVAQQLILVAAAGIVHDSFVTARLGMDVEIAPPRSLDVRTLVNRLRFGAPDRSSGRSGDGSEVDAIGRRLLGDTNRDCLRACRHRNTRGNFGRSGCQTACPDVVGLQRARISAGAPCLSPQPCSMGLQRIQPGRRGSRVDVCRIACGPKVRSDQTK